MSGQVGGAAGQGRGEKSFFVLFLDFFLIFGNFTFFLDIFGIYFFIFILFKVTIRLLLNVQRSLLNTKN